MRDGHKADAHLGEIRRFGRELVHLEPWKLKGLLSYFVDTAISTLALYVNV
jgi:hypothetical protein